MQNINTTIKQTIKKVAVAALLAVPLASNVVNTANVHAAAVHVSYPGLTDDSENASSWDMYDVDADGTSWRNFKTRSANIYVKDKSLLPATKKAIKFWSPVFKFKLVKSAKHASFHSKKYANVVIYDENYDLITPDAGDTSSTRVYENKNKKVIKYIGHKYQAYAMPHLNNKRVEFLKKHPEYIGTQMFAPKDWKKKAITNHLNMVIVTKNNSQQAITNKIIANLGQVIGLGLDDDFDTNPTDIMGLLSLDHNTAMSNNMADYNKTYHLSQADKDHIDWIYSHPYTGKVNQDLASADHSIY